MLTGKELGAAIAEAIRLKNVSKVAVATHFSVSPPSIQDWVNRGTVSKEKLPALWEYFSDVVGPEHWGLQSFPWATAPVGKPIVAIEDGEELPDGAVYIRESEVRLAAGAGQVSYSEDRDSRAVPYMNAWLRAQGISPRNARRFRVRGDSMNETLHDGDTVLVDIDDKRVVDGKVYAITVDGEFRVKRLYKRITGGLVIHSDNERHLPRDEELSAEQVDEHVHIVGRVRDKSGSGGL